MQDVLNVIGNSNFDEKLFSSQISFVKDFDEILCIVSSNTYRNNKVKEFNASSLSLSIVVQHNQAFSALNCTFFSTYEIIPTSPLYNSCVNV